MISNYDFLNLESSYTSNESNKVFEEIIEEKFVQNTSTLMIENLLTLNERFSEINSFLLTETEFIVNNNNVELELVNSHTISSVGKVSFSELLISLFEVENNLKFKVFDTEVDGKSIQNVVLKFSNFENSLNALQIMSKSENFSLKKAILEDNSDSIHLYISILQ